MTRAQSRSVPVPLLGAATAVLPLVPTLAFSEGWHAGLSFTLRPAWWGVVLGSFGLHVVVFTWVIKRPRRLPLGAAYALLMTCFCAGAGAAGCQDCRFDWSEAQLFAIFHSGEGLTWFDVLRQDGLLAAALTAFAVCVAIWPYARALQRAGRVEARSSAGPLGGALLLLSLFPMVQQNDDAALYPGTTVPPPGGEMFWTAAFTLGLVLCALALAPAFTNRSDPPPAA